MISFYSESVYLFISVKVYDQLLNNTGFTLRTTSKLNKKFRCSLYWSCNSRWTWIYFWRFRCCFHSKISSKSTAQSADSILTNKEVYFQIHPVPFLLSTYINPYMLPLEYRQHNTVLQKHIPDISRYVNPSGVVDIDRLCLWGYWEGVYGSALK